ncbi:MAG: flagellar basal body rod protein FlgB [Provencibacterium sp.]|jgi:flagellar basal-body rod protein FlgB|nr:flagellar basal body rod protein FlgB [Provencibacterium sp.]
MFLDDSSLAIMRASLNGLQVKQQVIAHNIANYETPDYKARTVTFEEVFAKATKDGMVSDERTQYLARIATNTNTEMRLDGNNVDLERENLELFDTYLQASYLYQKIGGQFSNLRYVLNQAMK